MPLIPVADLEDERLAGFRDVKDGELLRRGGLFVVEGKFAVRMLLERSRYAVRAVLTTEATLPALLDVLDIGTIDVFTATGRTMEGLLGFRFHHGCMALGARAPATDASLLLAGAGPLVLLEDLVSADNVGGIFRTSLALGVGGVLLSPSCCDPLYRKAVRGSIGASLVLPHTRLDPWVDGLQLLRGAGWRLVALTPGGQEELTAACSAIGRDERIALLVGNEHRGVTEEALAASDVHWRIAMSPGADSLNVVTAAGIALYQLRRTLLDS